MRGEITQRMTAYCEHCDQEFVMTTKARYSEDYHFQLLTEPVSFETIYRVANNAGWEYETWEGVRYFCCPVCKVLSAAYKQGDFTANKVLSDRRKESGKES